MKRLTLLGQGAALVSLAIAGVAAPLLARQKAPGLLQIAAVLALLGAAGSLLGMVQLVRKQYAAAQATLVAAMAGIWLMSIFYVYPEANRLNSPRFFAEEIRHLVPSDSPLDSYGLYHWRSGYIFYAQREMPRLASVSAAEQFFARGQRVFCVVPKEKLDSLRAQLRSPIYLLAEGGAGHHRDCLISNRPPA